MSDLIDIQLHEVAKEFATVVIDRSRERFYHKNDGNNFQMWLPVRVQIAIGKIVAADGWSWSKRRSMTRRFADHLQQTLKKELPEGDPTVVSGTRSISIRLT